MTDREIAAPHCVTVFGGGITGMTVAHELIERGFTVQVWEPATSVRHPDRGCDVGGLARTQWGAVPWATGDQKLPDLKDRGTKPILHLPHKFYFLKPPPMPEGQPQPRVRLGAIRALGPKGELDANEVAKDLIQELRNNPHIEEIYCEVFDREIAKGRTHDEVVEVARLALAELKKLESLKKVTVTDIRTGDYFDQLFCRLLPEKAPGARDEANGDDEDQGIKVHIAVLDVMPAGLPDMVQNALRFRVRERWLPGEHGFRFFPGFYHHLFDTMKRTPILDIVDKDELEIAQERSVSVNPNMSRYVETGRTTFDNLIPTYSQGVAFKDRAPTILPRSMPRSFEEGLLWARFLFGEAGKEQESLGATSRDAAGFGVRMLQFLTSCEDRRTDYDNISWTEFLGGGADMEETFSARFAKAAREWPEALVALDAKNADAHTQGLVSAQLLLDNSRPEGMRDATLNGPTSLAWLNPWRRYLEAQGVEFIHGKLEGFKAVKRTGKSEVTGEYEEKNFVWPEVRCFEPRYPGALSREPQLLPGYFVLALPATESWKMARAYVRAAKKAKRVLSDERDLIKMARYALLDGQRTTGQNFGTLVQDEKRIDKALAEPIPTKSELRHMVGIQYYFAEDLKWLDGHVTFTDSQLRLSSISQARFWADKHDWEHGHRGVLSVIVSRFDDTSKGWTKEQLVENIWKEVKQSLPHMFLPEPLYWHVDDGLHLNGKKTGFSNDTPLQVQAVGRWKDRPGEPFRPGDLKRASNGPHTGPKAGQAAAKLSAYTVDDGIILAGPFMKTFTRMTTMESANESGRHAVNALLQHYRGLPELKDHQNDRRVRSTPCEIFPPADREVADFTIAIDVDKRLHEAKCEHAIDILELGDVVAHGLSGRSRDPFNLAAMMNPLGGLVRDLFSNLYRQKP